MRLFTQRYSHTVLGESQLREAQLGEAQLNIYDYI